MWNSGQAWVLNDWFCFMWNILNRTKLVVVSCETIWAGRCVLFVTVVVQKVLSEEKGVCFIQLLFHVKHFLVIRVCLFDPERNCGCLFMSQFFEHVLYCFMWNIFIKTFPHYPQSYPQSQKIRTVVSFKVNDRSWI